MKTQSNTPTVFVAEQLIESRGVDPSPALPALEVIFSNEVSDDPHQLERTLILAGELIVQSLNLVGAANCPPQTLTFGIAMLQTTICAARELADKLGVSHE